MTSTELFNTGYTTKESIKEISEKLGEPKWLLERRYNAFENYKRLPFDKDALFYKYTTFRKFDPSSLTPAWKEASSAFEIDSVLSGDMEPYLIETQNGITSKLPEKLINQGIILDSLHNLLDRDARLAKELVKKATKISDGFDKLASLSRAFASNITILYVPEKVILEKPIVKITTIGDQPTAVFGETIAIFGNETKVTYLEVYQRTSIDSSIEQMYSTIVTTYIGENADIKTSQIQDWNRDTLHIISRITELDRYGKYRSLTHLQGSQMTRVNSRMNLVGQGSEGYDLFVAFGGKSQRFDVKSELHHEGRDTIGQTHARQVMFDKAESVLRGLIVIPKSGVNADSWLTSQGMTIGKGKVIAIPALQIDQNDVKAAHAASVEPLNEDLVFYLESRGIPHDVAREILVKGYFESVLKIFANKELNEMSHSYLDKKWDKTQE